MSVIVQNPNVQAGKRCCRGRKGRSESGCGGYSRHFILGTPANIADINSIVHSMNKRFLTFGGES